MKYILLAMVSILTLAALSLLIFGLLDSTAVDSEQEPAIQAVNQLVSNAAPLSEPNPELKSTEVTAVENCGESYETTLLELKQRPQSCQRHEDCQLKSTGDEGCAKYVVNKANGTKIDKWRKERTKACPDLTTNTCSVPADAYKYQALCIKNLCEKSKVIELKADPKEFIINTK